MGNIVILSLVLFNDVHVDMIRICVFNTDRKTMHSLYTFTTIRKKKRIKEMEIPGLGNNIDLIRLVNTELRDGTLFLLPHRVSPPARPML